MGIYRAAGSGTSTTPQAISEARDPMEKKQRVLRGHTRDPWPCCGSAADERWGRPKGTICDECKDLIRTGKDAIQEKESRSEAIYKWATQPHWWPQYYGPYNFRQSGTRTALANAMFNLVETLTTTVHTGWNADHEGYVLSCKDTRSKYDGSLFVSADRETREKLDELDAAIREALSEAYAEGTARGQRSLLQLAAGDMSLKDFEKGTIPRVDED